MGDTPWFTHPGAPSEPGPHPIDCVPTTPWSTPSPRAFRWRKLLETGVYGTIEELPAAEKINSSDVSRALRLALLAWPIVEATLGGRQPLDVTLGKLSSPSLTVPGPPAVYV